MITKKHNWGTFFSPRNPRISIQACLCCGIVKTITAGKVNCKPVSTEERNSRLRGWTTSSA